MAGRLESKKVLITGGNSGIGLATASLFVQEGASVIVTGRDEGTLSAAQATLQAAKGATQHVAAVASDTGDFRAIQSLMNTVRDQFGRLDVLFVNAAIAHPEPLELITEESFDRTVNINLRGAFFTIQQALAAGLLQEGSSIIVTTSISNQKGAPGFSIYAACKAALRSLVQSLCLELAPRKIRINAISPGPIDTPGFGRWGLPQEVVEAARQQFTSKSPVSRFGDADEIAKVALFLATDDSSYVFGAEIVVDGGVSLPI